MKEMTTNILTVDKKATEMATEKLLEEKDL